MQGRKHHFPQMGKRKKGVDIIKRQRRKNSWL